MSPALHQLSRSAWIGGLTVPVLPDGDEELEAELRDGYRALAEAVARNPPGDCAVQVRLDSRGREEGEAGRVRCALLVRARTSEDCRDMLSLAETTLSTRLAPHIVDRDDELTDLLRGPVVDRVAYTEIRRLADDVGPVLVRPPAQGLDMPAIARWDPDGVGLRRAATLLALQSRPALVVLHMEPLRPSTALLEHLDAVIRDIAAEQDVASSPLRAQIVAQYRSKLRDLPRAALQVRVVIAASDRPSPTLEAATGLALAVSGGFAALQATTDHQVVALGNLVTRLECGRPGPGVLEELSVACDAAEAAALVRFPVPAPSGTVGLASAPVGTLPRAAEPTGSAGAGRPLRLGTGAGGGVVSLGLEELKQHLVIAGLPGFGKTLTTQTLLASAWTEEVPFLVIDPAKSDYRSLSTVVTPLRVVELTPEQFAFNPFGVPAGCHRISHAGRVLAAFDAAFGLSREWPVGYVTLARSLYRTYSQDEVPTLGSLYAAVAAVIAGSKFQGPDGANLRASLLGRIELLGKGPLGVALSTPAEGRIDFADLLSQPTVIELRRFTGPMERSLVFALLLAGLISYRESNPVHGRLAHVTVLEEAHRLLRREHEGPASEGVRMFVEAIAELRGSGEGFVIVDQAPTLLEPGVMKLAGSMLSHRLVDDDERTTVGAAMVLDDSQAGDLARLETGEIVVHSPHRRGGVVARVRPPTALLAATPADAPSTVRNRLPWVAADSPDARGMARADRERRLREAPEWLAAFTELATDLAATRPDPLSWKEGLAEIEDAIRREVVRRTTGGES